jgi:dihydrofolate reductase
MYLTHVEATFADADVYFPAFLESEWEKELLESFTSDDRNEYNGAIWHYVKIRS